MNQQILTEIIKVFESLPRAENTTTSEKKPAANVPYRCNLVRRTHNDLKMFVTLLYKMKYPGVTQEIAVQRVSYVFRMLAMQWIMTSKHPTSLRAQRMINGLQYTSFQSIRKSLRNMYKHMQQWNIPDGPKNIRFQAFSDLEPNARKFVQHALETLAEEQFQRHMQYATEEEQSLLRAVHPHAVLLYLM